MSFGINDPPARQVRIDTMSHRNRSDRHTGQAAGCNDLRLELRAVLATTSTALDDFIGCSVHVSIKNLGGHETPTKLAWHQGAAARRLQ